MAQTKRCLDCRNCIGAHAWKVCLTPTEVRAELGAAVRRVEEGRRQYEERNQKRRACPPDTPRSPPRPGPSP